MNVELEQLIQALQLESHIEGGWYKRTYTDSNICTAQNGQQRALASSIYYLLTEDGPVGHLHKNTSTILHFFQAGDPLRYTLVSPKGEISNIVMGSQVSQGQQLQMHVPGGYWKASQLQEGPHGFGLISEVVVPEFHFDDMTLATVENIQQEHPDLIQKLQKLILST